MIDGNNFSSVSLQVYGIAATAAGSVLLWDGWMGERMKKGLLLGGSVFPSLSLSFAFMPVLSQRRSSSFRRAN